jgi:hypothetical protein
MQLTHWAVRISKAEQSQKLVKTREHTQGVAVLNMRMIIAGLAIEGSLSNRWSQQAQPCGQKHIYMTL